MINRTKYPIGIQTFSEIVEENYIYVDKTEYVYNITHNAKFVFLSRPRRFGKSLLTSTFESYFEARKELFQNLKLGQLEKEWIKYPVFRFDVSQAKNKDINLSKGTLNRLLRDYEEKYGVTPKDEGFHDRLTKLIQVAYEQAGQKVIILIDEYDSPMLEVMHDEEKLREFRDLFRSFYSPIKSCDQYIRFAFITGITKFSQLSIFSEINNLKLISMSDEYDAICGIAEDEMLTQLRPQIQTFADANKMTFDEAVAALKKHYDGYHFSRNSRDIFNPFSLINALDDKELNNYWFTSGTPNWLMQQIKKFNFLPNQFEGSSASASDFDTPTEGMETVLPLLYQSGYLTIKDYDPRTCLYKLAVPNNEVRIGIYKNLVPYYVHSSTQQTNVFIANFGVSMIDNKVEEALGMMRSFISEIPYEYLQGG